MREGSMMKFYRLLNRLFPTSFAAKVFFVAFVGTHVPLVTGVAYAVLHAAPFVEFGPILLLLLVATVLGSVATIASIWALLEPVRMARRSFQAMETGGDHEQLPEGYGDELGYLLRTINKASRAFGSRLVAAEEAAQRDPLTGCLNRRGFEEAVPPNPGGAVMYLDLDHFKRVNDVHGHDVGDAVLKAVADLMRRELRSVDILARFGGEEFVIWLPNAERDARQVADRLRVAVADTVRAKTDRVTASFGVAEGDGRQSVQQLLKAADAALYEAKTSGRNRVVVAGQAGMVADPGQERSAVHEASRGAQANVA